MTTAHRPTWKAAVGRESLWSAGGAASSKRSSLDQPAHLSLKQRQPIDRNAALKKSLLALEEAENSSATLKQRRPVIDPVQEERSQQRLLQQTTDIDEVRLKAKYDDSDVDGGGGSSDENNNPNDDSDLDAKDSDLDEEDNEEDDDDDEAALQAELAKIRAEREEAKRKEEEAATEEESSRLEEAAILGNPLLSGTASSGRLKRKWNDDVVFRNQAKSEPAPIKRFINDTVRNDFHKRFLNKFIR